MQETSFAPDKEHRIREDVERGHRQIETSPPVRVYSPRCQNISSSSPPTLHAESSTTPQGRYLQRDGGWHHSGRSDPGVISLHHSPEDRLPETQFLTGPSAVILPDNQDILPPSSFTQLSSFPGRPTLYNKCPNREYYPSRYHQSQFDALALQDCKWSLQCSVYLNLIRDFRFCHRGSRKSRLELTRWRYRPATVVCHATPYRMCYIGLPSAETYII